MLCRLYDNENECWIDDFYISPAGDVVIPKKSLFGVKLNIAPYLKYTYHMNTGLWDVNGRSIYEGDVCKLDIEDRDVIGVVAYAQSRASYYVFDNIEATYYPLNQVICDEHVAVIGNVFDGIENDE